MANGKLLVVAGRTRMGKSALTSLLIAKEKRVLIYDPKCHPDDYPGIEAINDIDLFYESLMESKGGPVKLRLMDERRKYFDMFSFIALAAAKDKVPCTAIADELSTVTSPGKAPDGWHSLCSQALGFGGSIIAITQRPAESDKTCFSNATGLIAFHMKKVRDRQSMADEMDIDRALIDNLKPLEAYSQIDGEPLHKIKIIISNGKLKNIKKVPALKK